MEKDLKMFDFFLDLKLIYFMLRYDCFLLQCSENKCVVNVLDKFFYDYEFELLKKEKEEVLVEEVKIIKVGKSY